MYINYRAPWGELSLLIMLEISYNWIVVQHFLVCDKYLVQNDSVYVCVCEFSPFESIFSFNGLIFLRTLLLLEMREMRNAIPEVNCMIHARRPLFFKMYFYTASE